MSQWRPKCDLVPKFSIVFILFSLYSRCFFFDTVSKACYSALVFFFDDFLRQYGIPPCFVELRLLDCRSFKLSPLSSFPLPGLANLTGLILKFYLPEQSMKLFRAACVQGKYDWSPSTDTSSSLSYGKQGLLDYFSTISVMSEKSSPCSRQMYVEFSKPTLRPQSCSCSQSFSFSFLSDSIYSICSGSSSSTTKVSISCFFDIYIPQQCTMYSKF